MGKKKDLKIDSELAGADKDKTNWKGIILAVLVILVIVGLVVIAIVFLTPKEKSVSGEAVTIEDFQSNSPLQPKSFSMRWLPDKPAHFVRMARDKNIYLHNVNGTMELLLSNRTWTDLGAELWYVSADASQLLLAMNVTQVFRHSFTADYRVVPARGGSNSGHVIISPKAGSLIQLCQWADKGQGMTLVTGNDLYYSSDAGRNWNKGLTNDGEKNTVYNGIADWVYEEEVLSESSAHWLSPNAQWLCYARFNDSEVRRYKWHVYGEASDLYGKIEELAYPKVGETNPTVELLVRSTSGDQCLSLNSPSEYDDGRDYYFTSVRWADSRHVLVTWTDRRQQVGQVYVYDTSSITPAPNTCPSLTGKLNLKLDMTHCGSGWLDLSSPRFIGNGSKYFVTLPRRETNDYFQQIAVVDTVPKTNLSSAPAGCTTSPVFLTQGTTEVARIVGYHEASDTVYYLTNHGDARRLHLYGTSASSTGTPACLTCDVEDCNYVSVSMSKEADFYLLTCQGPGVPTYSLRNTQQSNFVKMFEDNADVAELLQQKALPTIRYMQISVDGGKYKPWAKLYLPPGFDEKKNVKHPLVIETYNGPATTRITDVFTLYWGTYLSSTHKVIYAKFDGRGSTGYGNSFKHAIYKKLGQYEPQDQIHFAKELAKLDYVDEKRTALWGWSYGGFVTAHAMSTPDNGLTCGISVAPVSDWRYYDSIYTERYMGLPDGNREGYSKGNINAKADKIRDDSFFLIHGTADDNVHYQHTAHLIHALTEAEVQFRTMAYTDKAHSLSGLHTRKHLWYSMTDFLHNCFGGWSN